MQFPGRKTPQAIYGRMTTGNSSQVMMTTRFNRNNKLTTMNIKNSGNNPLLSAMSSGSKKSLKHMALINGNNTPNTSTARISINGGRILIASIMTTGKKNHTVRTATKRTGTTVTKRLLKIKTNFGMIRNNLPRSNI